MFFSSITEKYIFFMFYWEMKMLNLETLNIAVSFS